MRARAEAAEATARSILLAVVEAWKVKSLEDVTLQEVADRAGVTVQTVIRRFGSKEDLIDAALKADPSEIVAQRNTAVAGDLTGAMSVLLDHYEDLGDAVLRTLALEDRYPAAKRIAENGRAEHRSWCARLLAPPDADEELLDALVAATDVYVWKLIRRDLGRSRQSTESVMKSLVGGALEQADARASRSTSATSEVSPDGRA